MFRESFDLISFETAGLSVPVLFLLFSYILVIWPFSWVISKIMKAKWDEELQGEEGEGLKDAGAWIGSLERVLILTFIFLDHFQAIGFLITAKAIFRFNQLQEDRDRKRTEYVMIGTLLSFSLTILTGIFLKTILFDRLIWSSATISSR
jgi:hypothetical protein